LFSFRYNINRNDIYRGISDTTNSALLTSKLLTNGRNKDKINSCAMHTQELVITHALGIRARKQGGKVIDAFPEAKRLRSAVKELLSFIMDRKSKGRFREYAEFCKDHCGTKGVVLELPNDTRVAGTYRMYLSCLRSKRPINLFASSVNYADKMRDKNLELRDWTLLSEFEAVLKECHDLAMQSQVDMVGYNSFSYYAARLIKNRLAKLTIFDVIDIRMNYSPSLTRENLPMNKIERVHLTKETKELLECLDSEFEHYYGKPDDDQLILMFFHPYIIWNGYQYVILIVIYYCCYMFLTKLFLFSVT
jgi:hypothetical protein